MSDSANPQTTDVLVVGAGPAGLFVAFQLGLFGIDCLVVDGAERPGGQLSALYADKPIFDAPGFGSILAGELIERLGQQARLDTRRLILGARVESVLTLPDAPEFLSTLSGRGALRSKAIVLANGGGVIGAGPTIDGAAPEDPAHVDTERFETARSGIFAIGDGAVYPGKLRLILSAFHEAALVTQALRQRIGPANQAPRRRSGGRKGKTL